MLYGRPQGQLGSTHGSPHGTPGAQRIGDYEILRELGRGSMGIVYEAQQLSLQRRVALKVFQARGKKALAVERFRREAAAAAKLNHPGIVPVWGVGEDSQAGVLYYAMQLVAGPTLREFIHEKKPDNEAVARMAKQLAEALDYAHGQGVIHRDVKPANVVVTDDGRPLLTDFGLAKNLALAQVTQIGIMLGTPTHMSPEQARGDEAIDHRTDIYGLGACLYEMLTHRLPFYGNNLDELMDQVHKIAPVHPRKLVPTVPRDLETITIKCLEKDRDDRYDTAGDVAKELDRYLLGKPIRARPASPLVRAKRWVEAYPGRAAIAIAVVTLVVGLSTFLGWQRMQTGIQVAGHEEQARLAEARGDVPAALTHLEALLRLDPHRQSAVERFRALTETAGREQAEASRRQAEAQQTAMLAKARDQAAQHVARGRELGARARMLPMRSADRNKLESQALSQFGAALALDADNRAACTERGKLYLAQLEHAELAGEAGLVLHFRQLVQDQNRFHQFDEALREEGRVSLTTRPSGVAGRLDRLVPDPATGTYAVEVVEAAIESPVLGRKLRAGSYVFRVNASGFAPLILPFTVQRAAHVELAVPLLALTKIPRGFLYIPGGPAWLGGDPQAIRSLPRRLADVPGFLIGRTEVTIAEYVSFLNDLPPREAKKFLPRGSLKQGSAALCWPNPDGTWAYPRSWTAERPVTGITWDAARTYATWRGQREGVAYRLPTEEEWEKACRGADGRPYPWGSAPPADRVNVPSGRDPVPARDAGTVPGDESIYGVLDLMGNAAEWTRSNFDGRHLHCVVRGGAFVPLTDPPRAAARFPIVTDQPPHYVGFRLAADLPSD